MDVSGHGEITTSNPTPRGVTGDRLVQSPSGKNQTKDDVAIGEIDKKVTDLEKLINNLVIGILIIVIVTIATFAITMIIDLSSLRTLQIDYMRNRFSDYEFAFEKIIEQEARMIEFNNRLDTLDKNL